MSKHKHAKKPMTLKAVITRLIGHVVTLQTHGGFPAQGTILRVTPGLVVLDDRRNQAAPRTYVVRIAAIEAVGDWAGYCA